MTKFDLKQYLELVEFTLKTVEETAHKICKTDSDRYALTRLTVIESAEAMPDLYFVLTYEQVLRVHEFMAKAGTISTYCAMRDTDLVSLIGLESAEKFSNAVDSAINAITPVFDFFNKHASPYTGLASTDVESLIKSADDTIEVLAGLDA